MHTLSTLSRRTAACLRAKHTPKFGLISHKFYYGQGAELSLKSQTA